MLVSRLDFLLVQATVLASPVADAQGRKQLAWLLFGFVGKILAVEGAKHIFFGGRVVFQRTFRVVLSPPHVDDLQNMPPNFIFDILRDDPRSLQVVVLTQAISTCMGWIMRSWWSVD